MLESRSQRADNLYGTPYREECRTGMRLLIVEHDIVVRQLVINHLAEHGVAATALPTAAIALTELQHAAFDVAILGLSLADVSERDLLRALRAPGSTTHVIILNGAGDEASRMRAFDLGADDYVAKPFFVQELTARVLAVRRRLGVVKDTTLRFGTIGIDLAARQVTVDGVPVDLTVKEFDLLAFFAARPRHAFSRDELLRSVWKSAAQWQRASTVTEHVRRLRSKLEPDSVQPRVLRTVRGFGYRFDPA
jgi:DNA-binding response OmpR family regulator